MAEKTASLVGIWSASVSQAALVEVIDRMLELGPSIADTLSRSSPVWLRRNAMRFSRSVDRSRLIRKVWAWAGTCPAYDVFWAGTKLIEASGVVAIANNTGP